jgi:uncharacterized protein YggE
MQSSIRRSSLALAALALAVVPLELRAQEPSPVYVQPSTPQIVTSARGEIQATPDEATILFAVETRAATAAEAGARNARVQNAVLDTLRKMRFPANDIGTLGYSVQPEYRYPERGGEPTIVGYVARNSVRLKVRRIDQVGPAIDAALKAGANRVAGLNFESSKYDELRRQALQAAVRNARADAVAMATAAGGTLGDLIEIQSQMFDQPRPMVEMQMARGAAADASAPTPIMPGEQTVGVMVTVRWRYTNPR